MSLSEQALSPIVSAPDLKAVAALVAAHADPTRPSAILDDIMQRRLAAPEQPSNGPVDGMRQACVRHAAVPHRKIAQLHDRKHNEHHKRDQSLEQDGSRWPHSANPPCACQRPPPPPPTLRSFGIAGDRSDAGHAGHPVRKPLRPGAWRIVPCFGARAACGQAPCRMVWHAGGDFAPPGRHPHVAQPVRPGHVTRRMGAAQPVPARPAACRCAGRQGRPPRTASRAG